MLRNEPYLLLGARHIPEYRLNMSVCDVTILSLIVIGGLGRVKGVGGRGAKAREGGPEGNEEEK